MLQILLLQFGRRSEQLSPDQLQLRLEDLEQTIATNHTRRSRSARPQARPEPPVRVCEEAVMVAPTPDRPRMAGCRPRR